MKGAWSLGIQSRQRLAEIVPVDVIQEDEAPPIVAVHDITTRASKPNHSCEPLYGM
jgi:hypothetical protein